MHKYSIAYLNALISTLMALALSTPLLADDASGDETRQPDTGRVTELAQADQDQEAEEGILEEVIITGTRTQGRTVADSPVPIDSFNEMELAVQAHGDLTENLKNLVPSFTAAPFTGDASAFVRSTSLRGLPPDDVLLLINGKRRHRSSVIHILGAAMNAGAHSADMGPIPAIALKNVEVLRDGASSQYGSDAIAGVINFILRDAPEGGEVELQYGRFYEDEQDYKAAVNVGIPLGSDGYANLSFEWTDNEQLSRGTQRPDGQALIDAGVPGVGEDTPYDDAPFVQTWGRPENKGVRMVWNSALPVGDASELYLFGNYADLEATYRFFYRPPGHPSLQPIPIDPDDPSQGNFCFCDELVAGYTPYLVGKQEDWSIYAGWRGEFGNGMLYDFSVGYGENELDNTLFNTTSLSWGPDSQRDFDTGDVGSEDLIFNADFSKLITDDVNLAFGAEWREETWSAIEGDQQSWQPGPWIGIAQQINPDTGEPYSTPPVGSNGLAGYTPESSGSWDRDNWAVYADLEWFASDDFLLQAALRYEDFSDFGNTTNGKLAARWDIFDSFTLRGSVSTGFRAPTPGQANIVQITTTFDGITQMQTQQGTVSPTSPLAVENGGKALDAEESTNFTLGFNWDISDNFTITVDGYFIDVDDRITKTQFIPVVHPLFSELSFYTNAAATETKGLDIVAQYLASWSGGSSTNFTLAYNYNKTEVTDTTPVNGVDPISDQTIFNIEENLPKNRASLSIFHDFDRWYIVGRVHYYGKHFDERGPRDKVDAATLVDLEAGWNATDNFTFVLGAANVFDEYPNEIDTRRSQGLPYPRRTAMGYDGGMYYLRGIYRW